MEPVGPAIFTIGRMNPPTSGHLGLIRAMMIIALEQGQDKVYVILSHTKDTTKNPLGCDRKKAILVTEGMIESIKRVSPLLSEIEVNIRCMDEPVPEECGKHVILKQVCKIHIDAAYPTHMILVVGADRASDYTWIGKYLNKMVPPILLDTISLARPEGAMSATYMRNLVLEGNSEEFIEATTASGLSKENASILYAELKTKLRRPGEGKGRKSEHSGVPSKKRRKVKGGKKKRTKRRKRTNKKRKNRTYKKQKRQ
jgi:hypothetical protein